MTPLPPPPKEPKAVTNLDVLAPKFRDAVLHAFDSMHALGFDPIITESLRTAERQQWLYGFGRDYDDGRGVVTNAPTGQWSWHFFGLAVDVTSKKMPDQPGWTFWSNLGGAARRNELTWGGSWIRFTDLPHLQWGRCRQSPSTRAIQLYNEGGFEAVWHEVGAM